MKRPTAYVVRRPDGHLSRLWQLKRNADKDARRNGGTVIAIRDSAHFRIILATPCTT